MNEIYLKITDNIIHQFKSFKNGQTDSKNFNSNLMLQLSSIFKYKANGVNPQNLNFPNINNNNGDVYVPITRLEKSVQMKLKENSVYIDDVSERENEEEKLKVKKENLKNKTTFIKNQTLDLESEFYEIKDINDITEFNPKNQDNDFNFCESMQSISIFSDINSDNNNMNYAKNFNNKEIILENIMDTTEISTIYGKKISNRLNNTEINNESTLFADDNFIKFKEKFKDNLKETNLKKMKDNENLKTKTQKMAKSGKISSYGNINKNNLSESNAENNLIEENMNNNNSAQNTENNSYSNKSLVKQILQEINNELTEKAVKEFLYEMNSEYILSMYSIYSQIKDECRKYEECENLMFVNKFKSLILEIGISDKKFYEQSIREIIYNNNYFNFSEFLLCLHKLNYLKFNKNFLKYKFLLFISKKNNSDYLDSNDLEKFYELMKGRRIYDHDLHEKISTKLVDKYQELFPNSENNLFYFRKLTLVLEQFFDLR